MNNKRIICFLVTVFLCDLVYAMDFKSVELFKLSWGWESDSEVPFAIDETGGSLGPYNMFVDNQDNIYMAFPYSDFRKYDSLGNVVYRKEIFVHRFAVDNLLNVFYTDMNKMSLHSVNKINIDGSVSPSKHNFSLKGENANIAWIKANRNGEIIFGREFNSYKVMKGELVELSNESHQPSDSQAYSYISETNMLMTTRKEAPSFNSNRINLIKHKIENNQISQRDTIQLMICNYPHKAAEILQIDIHGNFYIWVYYNENQPIDLVVLDSSLKETARIELVPIAESMRLWLRPFIRPDGTIYEFRDLDDGLHVIRWSREE